MRNIICFILTVAMVFVLTGFGVRPQNTPYISPTPSKTIVLTLGMEGVQTYNPSSDSMVDFTCYNASTGAAAIVNISFGTYTTASYQYPASSKIIAIQGSLKSIRFAAISSAVSTKCTIWAE